jgi:ABC-type nitrate/sulfonate/bicarbonate transport system substrate-binding protein
MNRHRLLALLLGLGLLLIGCGGTQPAAAPASSAAPQKIKVYEGLVSFAQLPLPLAQEAGLFRKNGLDAEFTFGQGGVKALLAGEFQVAVSSPEEVVLANAGGANLVIVGALMPYLLHYFVVRPEIKAGADLKNKPMGVSKRGTVGETILDLVAKRNGLDPVHDFQLVELNTPDNQVTGLIAGSIYGTDLVPPQAQIAERQGMRIMYDFVAEHLEYPSPAIIVTRDWAAKNEPAILALLRGAAEAVQLYHTRPEVVTQAFQKLAKSDEALAKQALDLGQKNLTYKMLPTASGMRFVMNEIAAQQPAAAGMDPNQFIDDSYVKKLDQQGFYTQFDRG